MRLEREAEPDRRAEEPDAAGHGQARQVPLHDLRPPELGGADAEGAREPRVLAGVHEHEHDRGEPPATCPASASSRTCGSQGRSPTRSTAVSQLARASSWAWPTRPNPVTSVTAEGPAARAASAASRLSRVIEATAAATASSGA